MKHFLSFFPGDQTTEDDKFYIIAGGICYIASGKLGTARSISRGESFGQEELLYPQPRSATVTAQNNVHTWVLDRKTYTRLLHGTFIKKRALYSDFLSKISFLQTLPHGGLIQLADALQPHNFKQGEHLIRYGEEGLWFYIIVEGVVEVLGRDANNAPISVCEFKRGDCVGEMEFLYQHKTVADVVAKTREVRTAKLNRPHFEMCMGPLKEYLKEIRQVDPVFDYYRSRRSFDEGGGRSGVYACLPVSPLAGSSLISFWIYIVVSRFFLPIVHHGVFCVGVLGSGGRFAKRRRRCSCRHQNPGIFCVSILHFPAFMLAFHSSQHCASFRHFFISFFLRFFLSPGGSAWPQSSKRFRGCKGKTLFSTLPSFRFRLLSFNLRRFSFAAIFSSDIFQKEDKAAKKIQVRFRATLSSSRSSAFAGFHYPSSSSSFLLSRRRRSIVALVHARISK